MTQSLNRPILFWALYDFANSAFATTILSVIFNVYYVNVVCKGGVEILGVRFAGEALWGYSASISMLVVFLLAPVLGAAADFSSSKKRFLFLFWCLGWIFSSLLFFSREGTWLTASAFFILANVGFGAGNSFYNAFLNEISEPATAGRVSGFGWAAGYVGGGLLLLLNLAMIQHPEWFSIPPRDHMSVRATFLSVGIWWCVFAIPFFLWVREAAGERAWRPSAIREGYKKVRATFREVRRYSAVWKFFLAYLVYNDGIETMILMASIFGAKELAFSQNELILCFLMIQAVAVLGALFFGFLADRAGHKRAISFTLWIYLAVCLWAVFIRTRAEFWALGAVVGVILGGSQSASRSLLVLLMPPGKSAEFFGFFALTGKLSTVIGPFLFGTLAQLFSLRVAVGSLAAFFAGGLWILRYVKEPAYRPTFIPGLQP